MSHRLCEDRRSIGVHTSTNNWTNKHTWVFMCVSRRFNAAWILSIYTMVCLVYDATLVKAILHLQSLVPILLSEHCPTCCPVIWCASLLYYVEFYCLLNSIPYCTVKYRSGYIRDWWQYIHLGYRLLHTTLLLSRCILCELFLLSLYTHGKRSEPGNRIQ